MRVCSGSRNGHGRRLVLRVILSLIVPAPANIYSISLIFKLSGRPGLGATLNVETAGSERKKTAANLYCGVP